MNIDIAKLLESHRGYMLALANEAYDGSTPLTPDAVRGLTWAHDRATTKTLLDLYRQGESANSAGTVANAAPVAVINTPPSRRVKAGSKKAKDRAAKGAATRAANRAAKGNHHPSVPVAEGAVELSPATHLALAKVEGETGGAA